VAVFQPAALSWSAVQLPIFIWGRNWVGEEKALPIQPIENMVRPERFELPAFWFVASAAREIMNLQCYPSLLSLLHFQSLPASG
jgi:hypothetical protein